MAPIASILIDNFNQGEYLAQAIDSALQQSVDRSVYEIIVVDDGSTDSSAEVAALYGDQIKFIRQANGGQSAAFNTAIRAAKGKYLLLCDADDYLAPQRVEKIVEEFERYPELAIVFNRREVFGEGLEPVRESHPEVHDVLLSKETLATVLSVDFGTSRMAVRRSKLDEVLPLPEVHAIGADIYLMCLLWFGTVSSIPDLLTYYRVHDSNLFHEFDPKKKAHRADCVRLNVEKIRETIKKSKRYDPKLADEYLLYFDVIWRDAELHVAELEGRASWLESFRLEIDKIRLEAHTHSKVWILYKWLRLPLLFVLPRSSTRKLRDAWWSFQQKCILRKI